MATGYQAQHSRPRTARTGGRVGAGAVTAVIFVIAIAALVAATHGSDRATTAQSGRRSHRVLASDGTTSTSDSTTSPPNPDTTMPGTTTEPAAAPAAAGSQNLRTGTARPAPNPVRRAPTTVATATTRASAPPPPKDAYIPPTAKWTTFSCVAHGSGTGSETVVTYAVSFSGGRGWTAPGGGTTGTEVQSFPGSGSSKPQVVITTAHVHDVVNDVTRTVPLSNAKPIQC